MTDIPHEKIIRFIWSFFDNRTKGRILDSMDLIDSEVVIDCREDVLVSFYSEMYEIIIATERIEELWETIIDHFPMLK